ncbi:MAG: hypothetical protein D3910_27085, partial [Candidatus Electrothrix sp. ATG2]|nr:hypothetical protein [Candidatus Electrothrix sp. ATG2]
MTTKNSLHIGDTWETFLAQRDQLPNWKLPLNIAIVLHCVVFAGAAVLPDIGKKREPDQVIIIDLLSLPPAAPASVPVQAVASSPNKQHSASQQPKAVQKKAEQEIEQEAEQSIEPTKKPSAPKVPELAPVLPVVVPKVIPKSKPRPQAVAQDKAISLRPIKRKKKLTEDVRLAEEKKREKQQERKRLAASEKERGKKHLAEQLKREKAVERKRKLAEQKQKFAAQKKRQQKAEAKKRLAEQQRKKRKIAEVARLARQAEQEAEQARLEAAQARSEYASVAQASAELNTPLLTGYTNFSSGGRNGSGNGVYGGYGSERVNSAALNQYAASLNGRISSHWQL